MKVYRWSVHVAPSTVKNFEGKPSGASDISDLQRNARSQSCFPGTQVGVIVPISQFLSKQIRASAYQPLQHRAAG